MLHYHDQEHFGTCAAVAGNCPANLLITSLSAVSLEKNKKKQRKLHRWICEPDVWAPVWERSCWWGAAVWRNIWLLQPVHTLHQLTLAWQMGIRSSSRRSLQISVSHTGHGRRDLRAEQTSTWAIGMMERPLFETWRKSNLESKRFRFISRWGEDGWGSVWQCCLRARRLEVGIPWGAGLGSGSSVSAWGLAGLSLGSPASCYSHASVRWTGCFFNFRCELLFFYWSRQ